MKIAFAPVTCSQIVHTKTQDWVLPWNLLHPDLEIRGLLLCQKPVRRRLLPLIENKRYSRVRVHSPDNSIVCSNDFKFPDQPTFPRQLGEVFGDLEIAQTITELGDSVDHPITLETNRGHFLSPRSKRKSNLLMINTTLDRWKSAPAAKTAILLDKPISPNITQSAFACVPAKGMSTGKMNGNGSGGTVRHKSPMYDCPPRVSELPPR